LVAAGGKTCKAVQIQSYAVYPCPPHLPELQYVAATPVISVTKKVNPLAEITSSIPIAIQTTVNTNPTNRLTAAAFPLNLFQ
jgi:hypothetical protein